MALGRSDICNKKSPTGGTMKNRLLIIISVFVLLGLFQNCGQSVGFQDDAELISTEADLQTPLAQTIEIDSSLGSYDQTLNPESTTSPNSRLDDETLLPVIQQSGPSIYKCVLLSGAGDSLHIGFDGEELTAGSPGQNTVCISERACLEIIPLGFGETESKVTGHCRNGSPNTTTLSDAEVVGLVDAYRNSQ